MKDQDVFSGFVLILVSIWGIYIASRFPHMSITSLPPGFFPTVLFYGLGLCGAGLIYQGWRRGEKLALPKFYWRKLMPMLVLFGIYAGTLILLGFRLSTFIFVLACMLLLGERKPVTLISIPIVTSLGVYYLFSKVFLIALP